MSALASLFSGIEASGVAAMVRDSVLLTAVLSGIHLIGLTLIVGGAFVSSLRMLGILLPEQPLADVLYAPQRGILVGIVLSVLSGLFLLAPRIVAASADSIFQLKMLLVAAALAFHFTIHRSVTRDPKPVHRTAAAGLELVLWLGVAVAGCAFILFD